MTGKNAGFDFGIKCFLTASDGSEIHSPEYLKNSLLELKRSGRAVSSKVKGSKNRKKANKTLARTHRKVANQRTDFHFKLALKLFEQYDYLFFEDLNINAMKKLWGRKVSDYGFSQFLKIIEFKGLEHKKTIYKINRFFPSTKLCSNVDCGIVKKEMALSERQFNCECGLSLPRDLNAAINIHREGASSLGLDSVRRESCFATVA